MTIFVWPQGLHHPAPFPAGIILPFHSAGSIPDGWAAFSAANGKYIVGAGSSYAATTIGGSNQVSIAGVTTVGGAHAGSGNLCHTAGAGAGDCAGSITESHDHSVSESATVEQTYRDYRLIKAQRQISVLPPDVLALSNYDFSSSQWLSNALGTSDRLMKAAAADGGTGGTETPTHAFALVNGGLHDHANVVAGNCDTYNKGCCGGCTPDAGLHNHTGSCGTTLNTKRFYLAAWKAAHQRVFALPNMIGMIESATAPSGWALCDGTNGTPDLRDFFVRIGSIAQMGTFGGNNSSNWVQTSMSTSANHNHGAECIASGGSAGCGSRHPTNSGAHSDHSFSLAATYLPPYYALSFIMKLQ